MELVVVIVIVGILAVLGLVHYGAYKEKALNKEAVVNLQLIQAAEKIYRMENPYYYPYPGCVTATNNTVINQYLKLNLPTQSPNWNFTVDTASTGNASATRSGRTYNLSITNDTPTCTGTRCY